MAGPGMGAFFASCAARSEVGARTVDGALSPEQRPAFSSSPLAPSNWGLKAGQMTPGPQGRRNTPGRGSVHLF